MNHYLVTAFIIAHPKTDKFHNPQGNTPTHSKAQPQRQAKPAPAATAAAAKQTQQYNNDAMQQAIAAAVSAALAESLATAVTAALKPINNRLEQLGATLQLQQQ